MNFSHITVAGRPHPNTMQNRMAPVHSKVIQQPSEGKLQLAFSRNLEKTGNKVMSSLNKVGNIVADSLKDSGGKHKVPNCKVAGSSPVVRTRIP